MALATKLLRTQDELIDRMIGRRDILRVRRGDYDRLMMGHDGIMIGYMTRYRGDIIVYIGIYIYL